MPKPGRQYQNFLLTFLGVATALFSGLTACSLGFNPKSAKLIKECVLPKDQVGTISGYWQKVPIPISFHSGDFTQNEVTAMTTAADTWNSFFSASQGIPKVLDYGSKESVSLSQSPVPTDPCSMGLLQGGVFVGSVVIYRQNVWPHSGGNSVMALTSACPTSDTKFPIYYMAYVELNYQGFFRQGLQAPDLQTIVAHEFGHLLGLYHSCDVGSTKAGRPDCNKGGLSNDYVDALMFPNFGFNADGSGEVKRTLQSNDQGRANCLYGATGITQ